MSPARYLAKTLLVLVVAFVSLVPSVFWVLGKGAFSSWTIGEWLIDYSGGFVRRGLLGAAASLVHSTFGTDHTLTAQVFVICFQLLFVGAATLLFIRVPWTPANVLIYGSPAFLIFSIDLEGGLRKEIVMLGLFALFLALHHVIPGKAHIVSWAFVAVIPIVVLVHEGLFFFTPFLMLGLWLAAIQSGNAERGKKQILFSAVLGTLAFAISFWWAGDASAAEKICARLNVDAQQSGICDGAITYLGTPIDTALLDVWQGINNPRLVPAYALAAMLSLIPFLFAKLDVFPRNALVAAASFSLPLFVIAVDWGRWIHILVSLMSLLVLAFGQSEHARPVVSARQGTLFTLFVIVYVVSWSIPHARAESLDTGIVGLVIGLLA